jgi:hypothetical protein
MSAFVLFVIVLTFGYILYYAAMLTIDLNAKSKSEASPEETTIPADGLTDGEEEYAPRNVVENTATGGFGFEDPAPAKQEEPVDIMEAHETEAVIQEAADEVQPVDDVIQREETYSEEVLLETTSSSGAANEEAAVQEAIREDEEAASGTDAITEERKEDVKSSQPEDEPFDENKAFDKTLFTPTYGIKTIVAPSVSAQTASHASEINAALATIATKPNGMDAYTLSQFMRKGEGDKLGLDLTDEVQKY